MLCITRINWKQNHNHQISNKFQAPNIKASNKPEPEQKFYHESTKFLKHEKEHFFYFVISFFRVFVIVFKFLPQ